MASYSYPSPTAIFNAAFTHADAELARRGITIPHPLWSARYVDLQVHVANDPENWFQVQHGKLYWASADGWTNTERRLDDEPVTHVTLTTRRGELNLFWPTWKAFADAVGLPGDAPPKNHVFIPLRMTRPVWDWVINDQRNQRAGTNREWQVWHDERIAEAESHRLTPALEKDIVASALMFIFGSAPQDDKDIPFDVE